MICAISALALTVQINAQDQNDVPNVGIWENSVIPIASKDGKNISTSFAYAKTANNSNSFLIGGLPDSSKNDVDVEVHTLTKYSNYTSSVELIEPYVIKRKKNFNENVIVFDVNLSTTDNATLKSHATFAVGRETEILVDYGGSNQNGEVRRASEINENDFILTNHGFVKVAKKIKGADLNICRYKIGSYRTGLKIDSRLTPVMLSQLSGTDGNKFYEFVYVGHSRLVPALLTGINQ